MDKKENASAAQNHATSGSKYGRRKDVSGISNNSTSYLGLFPGFNFADLQNTIEAQRACKIFLKYIKKFTAIIFLTRGTFFDRIAY